MINGIIQVSVPAENFAATGINYLQFRYNRLNNSKRVTWVSTTQIAILMVLSFSMHSIHGGNDLFTVTVYLSLSLLKKAPVWYFISVDIFIIRRHL